MLDEEDLEYDSDAQLKREEEERRKLIEALKQRQNQQVVSSNSEIEAIQQNT